MNDSSAQLPPFERENNEKARRLAGLPVAR